MLTKSFLILIILTMTSLSFAQEPMDAFSDENGIKGSTGGSGTGNSGDIWRSSFEDGKVLLRQNTIKLKACLDAIENLNDEEQWLSKNIVEFYNEATRASFEIAPPTQNSCAWTLRSRYAPILINGDICVKSNQPSKENVARLIAHEIVHHFDVDDESFADRVSSVVNAATDRVDCLAKSENTRFRAVFISKSRNKVFTSSEEPTLDRALAASNDACSSSAQDSDCVKLDWLQYEKSQQKLCVSLYRVVGGSRIFRKVESVLDRAESLAEAECELEGGGKCEEVVSYCSDGFNKSSLMGNDAREKRENQIASGLFHTCGLVGKKIFCKGSPHADYSWEPTFKDEAYDLLLLQGERSCGLSSGRMICWGGVMGSANVPEANMNLENLSQIGVGGLRSDQFVCGLENNNLRCWGWGERSYVFTPQKFKDPNYVEPHVTSFAASAETICFVKGYEEILCTSGSSKDIAINVGLGRIKKIVGNSKGRFCALGETAIKCWKFNPIFPISIDTSIPAGGVIDIFIPDIFESYEFEHVIVLKKNEVFTIDERGSRKDIQSLYSELRSPKAVSADARQVCVLNEDSFRCEPRYIR